MPKYFGSDPTKLKKLKLALVSQALAAGCL